MYFPGIEAFLAIARTESISKAAELLNLSQSTMSYRLKTLEQEMGGVLVERGKGQAKIRLTPMGESFYGIAERWDALRRETRILQVNGPRPSLAISAAESLNHYILPPVYRILKERFPPMRLQIRTEHTAEAYDSIERREMDVAFVVREKASPNLAIAPFFSEEMVLLRPAVAGRRSGDIVDISELAPDHELYVNWNTAYQLWHDRWWDPVCSSRIHLDAPGLITTFMQDGKQWAIVPVSVGTHLARMEGLVLEKLSEPAPQRIYYKVTHKYPSRDTRQILDLLDQCLQDVFGRK